MWAIDTVSDTPRPAGRTLGGIPVTVSVTPTVPAGSRVGAHDVEGLWLRVEHARLRLLRGFEELLCLEGLHGVEHLPHQIETVRRVLRHFRGGVLLADEVGLGKTIEAGLLLREYLLRGMIKRVLILVPPALVSQWSDELSTKFGLDFATAESGQSITDAFWRETDRVLASLSLAKSVRHFEAVTACPWDLVIVDEAHHCRNRATRNWQLVNALQRRRMFLLTATPVQNDLMEIYNLLTLLEPGHLKTESDFKRNYVRRGNPRDPRNRQRLRGLLGEVMLRNTRSLVTMTLPPRYAQTLVVRPDENEAKLYQLLDTYLRWRSRQHQSPAGAGQPVEDAPSDGPTEPDLFSGLPTEQASAGPAELSRMRINSLLRAAGSHPAALCAPLTELAAQDDRARPILELARKVAEAGPSSKEARLVELLRANR